MIQKLIELCGVDIEEVHDLRLHAEGGEGGKRLRAAAADKAGEMQQTAFALDHSGVDHVGARKDVVVVLKRFVMTRGLRRATRRCSSAEQE